MKVTLFPDESKKHPSESRINHALRSLWKSCLHKQLPNVFTFINPMHDVLGIVQCNASFRSDHEKLTWNIACCTEKYNKTLTCCMLECITQVSRQDS